MNDLDIELVNLIDAALDQIRKDVEAGDFTAIEELFSGGCMSEVRRRVDVVVSLWIDEDADVQEVMSEMDYDFRHPAIKDMEIVDICTEI